MELSQSEEIWRRLATNEPLNDLGLPTKNGRVDLRGLIVPVAGEVGVRSTRLAEIRELAVNEVRGVRWSDLDLTGVCLDAVRLFDCRIENCLFERARCQDLRMWGTTVQDSIFRKVDLRKSALGGVDGRRRNCFRGVAFEQCDLRQTAYVSAQFEECRFDRCKLAKVDFQGSTFSDCTFTGDLSEVLFYRFAHDGQHLPPNEMRHVDLSKARLQLVEFRGLDMDTVVWPEDGDHVVARNYRQLLECMTAEASRHSEIAGKQLAAILRLKAKWAGPNQESGIFGIRDFETLGGDALLAEFRRTYELCTARAKNGKTGT